MPAGPIHYYIDGTINGLPGLANIGQCLGSRFSVVPNFRHREIDRAKTKKIDIQTISYDLQEID